jgi:hypothetical protein
MRRFDYLTNPKKFIILGAAVLTVIIISIQLLPAPDEGGYDSCGSAGRLPVRLRHAPQLWRESGAQLRTVFYADGSVQQFVGDFQ